MIWDLYAIQWELYVMLWENLKDTFMVWYGMQCYGMKWDLKKHAFFVGRVPKSIEIGKGENA